MQLVSTRSQIELSPNLLTLNSRIHAHASLEMTEIHNQLPGSVEASQNGTESDYKGLSKRLLFRTERDADDLWGSTLDGSIPGVRRLLVMKISCP